MQPILELTNTEIIRSLFDADGDAELTDQQLMSMNLGFALQVEFDDWLNATKHYTDIISEGTVPGATEEQKLRYRTLQLYAQYFCGWYVANSSEYSLLDTINDGQSEVRRPKRDVAKFLDRLAGLVDKYKDLLLGGLGVAASNPPQIFGVSSPSFDPVTAEET